MSSARVSSATARGARVSTPVGALLAGGASSRMGRRKADLEIGGMTLAARALATLRQVADRCVQVGGAAPTGLGIEVWPDLRPGLGPAAGVEAALRGAGEAPVVALAVDLPLAPPGLLRAALSAVEAGAVIAAPRWPAGRWHPLCAAYSQAALAPLQARLDGGVRDLQGLLDELAVAIEGVALRAQGDPERMLLNVNTPADLGRAAALLGAG